MDINEVPSVDPKEEPHAAPPRGNQRKYDPLDMESASFSTHHGHASKVLPLFSFYFLCFMQEYVTWFSVCLCKGGWLFDIQTVDLHGPLVYIHEEHDWRWYPSLPWFPLWRWLGRWWVPWIIQVDGPWFRNYLNAHLFLAVYIYLRRVEFLDYLL